MAKTTVLEVPDMTCGHCETSVKETLAGLPGVESGEADHVTARVEVSYEKTDQEHFGRAIEEAGYTLTTS